MRLKYHSFLLALMVTGNAVAHNERPLSLFHTPEHIQKVMRLRAAGPIPSHHTTSNARPAHVRLDGLMYFGPTSWRLWINGKPYDKRVFPNLTVVRVTATHATFSWQDQGITHSFTLAPSHSFPHNKGSP
ncbi:MAG: hypothetical protein ACK5TR_04430 [Alphaproteobacteria bacterium]|jgi:hypothetical protein|nr:hypothetical protein [Alphaproteobacteria bacterium]